MLFKIKLENDIGYDYIDADCADDALNIWLNNHTEYWLKNVLSEENYKQLYIDFNGVIYDIDIQLKINVNKRLTNDKF